MASATRIAVGTSQSHALTAAQSRVDGYYYWQVLATNSFGSGVSTIFEIGVDTTAPAAPVLLQPADGADPGTKTPTFTWQPVID